jgi:hypothetical protein
MANKVHAGPCELPNALMVEGLAGGTYLPGNIVTKSGNDLDAGGAATVGQLLIAKENGPGVGGHIDDAFVVGAPIDSYVARQGLFFRVRLATGQALVAGETLLERGAAGRLVVLASGVAVAMAKTTVTTTGDDELVLVEVL